MVQNAPVEVGLTLFQSGFTVANQKHIDRSTNKEVRFYAVWALIQHPVHGPIVFDTGYAPRFREATRFFPDRIYAYLTPVTVDETETAAALLDDWGIPPDSIKTLIVSHFHADHIGGLKDFPAAHFICARAAWEQADRVRGWGAVRKGVLKKLIPEDFGARVSFVEDLAPQAELLHHGLYCRDLYHDGSIQVVSLPGHARGQIGLRLNTQKGIVFLGCDAVWDSTPFERKVLPSPLVKLFFDDWKAYKATFHHLYDYHRLHPEEPLLFTHCPRTLAWLSNYER